MLYGTAKRTPCKRRMVAGTPTPGKVKKVGVFPLSILLRRLLLAINVLFFSPPVYTVQRHLDNVHPYQPPLFRPGWNLVPVFHPETASVCQQGVSVVSFPSLSKSALYSVRRLFYVYRHHELG